ncbi:histone-like transcription factor (CBF/NF-Y) and archaeal histone domain-containing protein [Ditylenchus destructor]|uniref:Histone-like transcription factor (CBF/NF-Y) and archaeal histone domain-containing protein n=1 Tax=Ditylenchus destructor TaxID=166010 RepID=A0AAD4NBY6_9BILA|nr:histone-like transcription factor (CBF/NF-Y) and archaeal histone domain-containing protein [Ditylenchus destructor]
MDSAEESECSTSNDDPCGAGRIRKRRFSNARIQPTRIKKVMQSDEDIGRMVASVPVAIGSAMEHFAEKLLEASAQCVQFSTSRTLSPMHMRYAVMQNPHFAFLESIMKDVPLPKMASTSDTGNTSATQLYEGEQLYFQASPQNIPGFNLHQNMFPDFKSFPPIFHPPQMQNDLFVPQIPTKTAESLLSTEPKCEQPENEGAVKRKRGRPRKDRKDKFVQDGLLDGQPEDKKVPSLSIISKNGQTHVQCTPNQLDAILMPPPKLPINIRSIGRPSTSPTQLSPCINTLDSPQLMQMPKENSPGASAEIPNQR